MSLPENLLDPALYVDVRRPLLQASTLPPWCYSSPEFYRAELKHIFATGWTLVGRVDELPERGDFSTHHTTRGSVLVVRDDDGELRAFYNACRHRGTELLTGTGRCQRVVCPYHSWVYSLDGGLLRAPGMEDTPSFSHLDYGLLPLRLETWGGFVFINHSAEAPPLVTQLGDMGARFAGYRLDDLVCVRRLSFEVQCNWKLLLENALEAYHTPTVHRTTLGGQTATHEQTLGEWDALYIPSEQSIAVLPGQRPVMPCIAGLDERARHGAYFTVIYPATQLAFAPDCVWWLAVQPLGPARCTLDLGSCFPRTTTERADFAELARPYFERWDSATSEDNAIAERQQRGQEVAARVAGRFSASEFAVHGFDNWVLERVLGDPAEA